MVPKLAPIVGAALAGALVVLVTNLLGLSQLATMMVAAPVLVAVVAVGTPLAFGVHPPALAKFHGRSLAKRFLPGAASLDLELFERQVRVLKLWHEGATLREIARDLGLTESELRLLVARMRRDGWKLPPRGDSFRGKASLQRERIAELWVDGVSIDEIAEIVGVPRSDVAHEVMEGRPPQHRASTGDDAQAREQHLGEFYRDD